MEEKKSRFRTSPQAWHALVEELASSGMSTAEFCRRHAIPVWQMHYWLKRENDRESTARGFVEIGQTELKPVEGIWVEAGRFIIRIEREFDAALL